MAWYTEVADMIAKFTVNSQGLAGVKGALSATEGSVLGSLVKQTERGSLNSIMSAMKGVGAEFSDDFAKEIAGSAGTTSRASIFEKLAANAGENYKPNEAMEKLIKDYTTDSDMAKRFSTYLSSGGTQADVAKYLGKKGDTVGIGGLAKGYFGDEVNGAVRKKVAIGGYAAGAIGLRTLSGGDLTHNARGENDIAGIPFF